MRRGPPARHSTCAAGAKIGRPALRAASCTAHARRPSQRALPLLPRGRVAPRAARQRSRRDPDGRDGGRVGGRGDLLSPEAAAGLAMLVEQTASGSCGSRTLQASLDPLPDVSGCGIELAVPGRSSAAAGDRPLEASIGMRRSPSFATPGSTSLIGRGGPAAAVDSIDGLVRTIQIAAEEHGVTFLESDVDRDGGRIILVAGARAPRGRRRAAAPGSAIDGRLGPPLPVHIGVSRGRVFAGQVGASFRRTYTILGHGRARGAADGARPGERDLGRGRHARASRRRFAATALEPFTVKGKSEPVRAFVLGGLGRGSAGRGEKLPFVDRERERAVLALRLHPCGWVLGRSSSWSASRGSASPGSPRSSASATTCRP